MFQLAGERLTLRDFVPADEAALHEFCSDPVVTEFTDWGPNTVEDTRSFVADVLARQDITPRETCPRGGPR